MNIVTKHQPLHMKFIDEYDSPLGKIILASDGLVLTGLWFQCQQYFGQGLAPEHSQMSLPIFEETKKWLAIYFSGEEPKFIPLIQIKGTAFRKSVWEILCTIPYGEVTTYGAIAKELTKKNQGKQMSAQAVGGAIGHNLISLIIPCHRVIGSDGNLTGYAGGIERKRKLLEMEKDTYKLVL